MILTQYCAQSLDVAALCDIPLPYTISERELDMSVGTVFINNRTQAVRLPLDVRLPESVRRVEIRAKGNERIIAPFGQTWDSFFLDGPAVSDDFMSERASQFQPEREPI